MQICASARAEHNIARWHGTKRNCSIFSKGVPAPAKHMRCLRLCAHDANTQESSSARVVEPQEILSLLSHRQPFLLVDRITAVEPGVHATAVKNVTFNDNFFQGHFPENPIMPGVLQVEACAQAAGVCLLSGEQFSGSAGTFFFSGIESCKFKRVVQPGDTLTLSVEATKVSIRWGIARFSCIASVDGETACEVNISLVASTSSS